MPPGSQVQLVRVLKQDALGRVELLDGPQGALVRRVACGGKTPFSGALARVLLRRERRALQRLAGLAGVSSLVEQAEYARLPGADGAVPPAGATLLRGFLPGTPLCAARALPRDFFERLEELVRALHARGVCHNDLHKEANVLVGADGFPALVDFQLASRHPRGGALFVSRAREDLRHVWKHRSLYLRALGEPDPLAAASPRRSLVAEGWRRAGKPLYNRLLRGRFAAEGELRRSSRDPWPSWTAPVGPRALSASAPGSSPAAPARPR